MYDTTHSILSLYYFDICRKYMWVDHGSIECPGYRLVANTHAHKTKQFKVISVTLAGWREKYIMARLINAQYNFIISHMYQNGGT